MASLGKFQTGRGWNHYHPRRSLWGDAVIADPARRDARRNGAMGCLPLIGAVAVSMGAYAMGGTAKGWDAVAYWLLVAFVVIGLLCWAIVQFAHWQAGEKDCNEADQMERNYKPRVWKYRNTPVENTGAIHYDGVVPDSVNVSVDGVHYVMDTRTGELTPGELE
jgi:hypothetical protein